MFCLSMRRNVTLSMAEHLSHSWENDTQANTQS